MRRFSIRSLIAFVVVSAIGLAALRVYPTSFPCFCVVFCAGPLYLKTG